MLTQVEADTLIAMGKAFANPTPIAIPPGLDETHDLIGDDKREKFLFDIWRGTLRLSKVKFQTRGRRVIVLVRLDVEGAPHTNPDGTKIGGTHIHLYREGFEAKWAYPLEPTEFTHPAVLGAVYTDFCRYCSIANPPSFQESLL